MISAATRAAARLDLGERRAVGLGLGLDRLGSARSWASSVRRASTVQADPLGLAHDLLEVLRRRQPLGLGALPRGGAGALALVERGDPRLRPAHALLGLLHLALQAPDLRAEIADRALPREERGVAAARGPPAAEGARRARAARRPP